MATNSLTRTSGNVNGQFVYRHTQIADQNNSVYGQDGSIWTLFYGNSSRSGYNNPFVSSAEWRMLNLRLTKSPYNGKLEFGFSNNSSNPLSAICGFTVGIPPLYATHINTIARSVAYGFIRNPMADDGSLWIVHENTINQLSGTYGIDDLSITVEGNQVTYKTGDTELSTRTITYTDAHLYVVGACGYAGNSIVNVGLENGSGFDASLPDWDNKEIWILCNGLTNNPQNYYNTPHETTNPVAASTLTRLDVKLQQNASFTMEFPDESTTAITQSDNNYKTTPNNKTINAQIPIVVKLKFNNFSHIKGLKIICQMTGTETSLTRFRTDNTTLRTNLNNLEELQLRSSASSTQSRFAPGIGIAPLPLQNLKSLVIEGSFDVNSIVNNLHKCVNLEELYSDLSLSLYAFKISAMRKLRYLYFSKFTGLGTTGITFSGFRELFNPSRTSNITHGLYYTWVGAESILVPEYAELATAQVSAIKLYGWSHTKLGYSNYGAATPNYTTFIGAINFGFIFNGGANPLGLGNNPNYAGRQLVNGELSFTNNGTQCKITLKGIEQTSVASWVWFFTENVLICFKKQPRYDQIVNGVTLSGWKETSTNHELRRVGNTSYAWNIANSNLDITFNLKPIKNQSSISGLNITTDNAYNAGITGVSYFTLSANSAVFNNISIGDTVRVNAVTLPLSNATPSIVVDKSSNNQTVTVLKGSVNNDIIDGNNQTAIFNYEFPSATTEAITNTSIYTNNIDTTVIVTWNPSGGSYIDMAAAFAYMFEGVGGGY